MNLGSILFFGKLRYSPTVPAQQRGHYMSARVLLHLLNEFGGGGEREDTRLCRASYRFSRTS